jgi:hypothetical protein
MDQTSATKEKSDADLPPRRRKLIVKNQQRLDVRRQHHAALVTHAAECRQSLIHRQIRPTLVEPPKVIDGRMLLGPFDGFGNVAEDVEAPQGCRAHELVGRDELGFAGVDVDVQPRIGRSPGRISGRVGTSIPGLNQ